eukprot:8381918-Ditylum_brightwellii.AAC.1
MVHVSRCALPVSSLGERPCGQAPLGSRHSSGTQYICYSVYRKCTVNLIKAKNSSGHGFDFYFSAA